MPTSRTLQSQTRLILNHLRSKDLTPGEALILYGTFRLAARIRDLRQQGHIIETTIHKDMNGHRYARYHLVEEIDDAEKARLQEGIQEGSRKPESQAPPRRTKQSPSRGRTRRAGA